MVPRNSIPTEGLGDMSKIGGVVIAGVLAVGGIGAYEKWGKGGEDNTVRDQSGEIVEQGELGVFVLRTGDCFDDSSTGDDGANSWYGLLSIEGQPCSSPHDSEAVGEYQVAGEVFRSTEEYFDESESKCKSILELYSGKSIDELIAIWPEIGFSSFVPTAESFAEDDRIVTCYVFLADETKFAKSVQG